MTTAPSSPVGSKGQAAAPRPPLRIGLSARLLHDPPPELGFPGKTLQYLEQSVAHWIMKHGALAFMIPTISVHDDVARSALSVRDCVAAFDGLILQGGADVSPVSYGETAERPEWAGDRIRDLYEIELIWEFIMQNKPVLGICRGCQLINVAMGGTLWQDIATHVPNAIAHRVDELYDRYHHPLEIVPGSRLAALYPDASAHLANNHLVNSIHHQGIRKLGNDLQIEAISPQDQGIEAIRWTGSGYVMGVQWHPEFHGNETALLDSTPILQEFLQVATAQMLKPTSAPPAAP